MTSTFARRFVCRPIRSFCDHPVRSVLVSLTETRTLPDFHVYTSRTADSGSLRVDGVIGNVLEIGQKCAIERAKGSLFRAIARIVDPPGVSTWSTIINRFEDNPAASFHRINSSGTNFQINGRAIAFHSIRDYSGIALDKPRGFPYARARARARLRLKIARCRCLTKPVSFGSANLGVYTKVVCESAPRARPRESMW